jgi:hypothetical protein
MFKEAGPLPYYALSSLLTAFSHDVPTLPLIQHIFDYVLARPPIVLIYLTAAVRPLCGTHLVYLCRKEVSKSYQPGLTKTAGELAKPDPTRGKYCMEQAFALAKLSLSYLTTLEISIAVCRRHGVHSCPKMLAKLPTLISCPL